MKNFLLSILCMIFLTTALFSCVVSTDVGVRSRDTQPPIYSQSKIYKYRYYPDNEVYYDTERRMYFFQDNGGWRTSVELPRHLRINLGDRNSFVTIDMDSPRPDRYHDSTKLKHPSRHRRNR